MAKLSENAKIIIIIVAGIFALLSIATVIFIQFLEDYFEKEEWDKLSTLKNKEIIIDDENSFADNTKSNESKNEKLQDILKSFIDNAEKKDEESNDIEDNVNIDSEEDKTDSEKEISNNESSKTATNVNTNRNIRHKKTYIEHYPNNKKESEKILYDILGDEFDDLNKQEIRKENVLKEFGAESYTYEKKEKIIDYIEHNEIEKSREVIKRKFKESKLDFDNDFLEEDFEDVADSIKKQRKINPEYPALEVQTVTTPYIIYLGSYFNRGDAIRVCNIARNKGINAFIYRDLEGRHCVESKSKYNINKARELEKYFIALHIEASIRAY